jgi:hypothetical protein
MRLTKPSTNALLSATFISLLAGCANPFKQFYQGQTAASLNASGSKPLVAVTEAAATVVPTANITTDLESRLQDGDILLGWSNWNGADVGSESQAQEQAKEVGASVVLWSYQHASTSTGVIPVTMPTTTTSYDTGTVYGSYGSASWSGTTTTYGTRTTYMPYTVHRYNVSSAFLAKRLNLPYLGVLPRELTPAEQTAAGTTKGVAVALVMRRSPAADAGIVPADVVCSINGEAAGSIPQYTALLEKNAGKTVEVVLRRNGETVNKSIRLNP